MRSPKPIPGSTIRRTWQRSPVTRVHDGDVRKNKKAERRLVKKRLAEALRDEPPAFYFQTGFMDVVFVTFCVVTGFLLAAGVRGSI